MSMKITVNPYLAFLYLCDFLKHELRIKNLRIVALIGVDPLSVQIDSSSRIPIVAANYAVWI